MGLGPLICPDCLVYAHNNTGYNNDLTCPLCNTDVLEYLWMFTAAEQQEIAKNTRFINFVQGKNP